MTEKELHLDFVKKVYAQKSLIVEELYEWAVTFIGERDSEGELTFEPYDKVFKLAERLENDACNEEDYDNIDFHIYQINYDEERITL